MLPFKIYCSMGLLTQKSVRYIVSKFLDEIDENLPFKKLYFIGWGAKPSGKIAARLGENFNLDTLLLEDGFLQGVGDAKRKYSIVVDRNAPHYCAEVQSNFVKMVRNSLSESEIIRTHKLIALWQRERLSKYNAARDKSDEALKDPYILVCDQVYGDLSIDAGLASPESFQRMLNAACVDYPDHTIILKTHPDILSNHKKGHFDLVSVARNERITIISDPDHVSKLIEYADAVYTVTSQVGFEALIWGKLVRCFGMPFYAGWGLTVDELPAPDHREPVKLEQLVFTALVKYPRYIDPVEIQLSEPEILFRHVGLQRRKRQEFPEQIVAIGFSPWKKPFLKAFLGGSTVKFIQPQSFTPGKTTSGAVAVWGNTYLPGTSDTSNLLRIEDGFLRSSGLGADLVRPLSLVIDDVGIYYDATRPSRLENILCTQNLDTLSTKRARALRERLVQLDLTKYNLSKQSWSPPETDQSVLLVVGQVETDASIHFGSPDVKSNLELLTRVKKAHPKAYIIFKPHPDVVAGLRKRGQGEDACAQVADIVLSQSVALSSLIEHVDEVHTMTSLLGFEAIIRGATVVCHGIPFYAGWGLTQDKLSCSRRTRKLTLDELIHGALIEYPRYYDFRANCFLEPEQAIEQLAGLAETGPKPLSLVRQALRLSIIGWNKVIRTTK